jgi:transposase InsO family protein
MNQSTQRVIKNKLGVLNLARELNNIAKACRMMGMSRDTFYRYQAAVEAGGLEALLDTNRRKPNPKNRIDELTEEAVVAHAIECPANGQKRASNELRKAGIFVSPGGVRCIWLRHNLETFKKRLKALEAKIAADGIILTESQMAALERKQEDDVACGEIETHHPGYLGSQDTFYVGHLKGVGRIYQQTYVDTYAKVAFCKLYTNKTPITSADLLNDKVLPFFESHQMPVLRILTDRGTEFCGKPEQHDYQLFLAVNEIEHTKTKARSPQTNGICERFHKTILQEFYQVAFRKKLYTTLDQLQADLDQWLEYYNNERTHQGKMCNGRTPLQTLIDAKEVTQQKQLN